jgi:hypothetical protein
VCCYITQRFTDIINFMQQYQEKEKKKKKEQQQKQAEEQVRSSGYNRYDINEKQLWRTKLKGTGANLSSRKWKCSRPALIVYLSFHWRAAAEDWDIDTRGTFAGLSGLQSISSAFTSTPSSTTQASSLGYYQPTCWHRHDLQMAHLCTLVRACIVDPVSWHGQTNCCPYTGHSTAALLGRQGQNASRETSAAY